MIRDFLVFKKCVTTELPYLWVGCMFYSWPRKKCPPHLTVHIYCILCWFIPRNNLFLSNTIHFHLQISMFLHDLSILPIYIYLCVCVCVCDMRTHIYFTLICIHFICTKWFESFREKLIPKINILNKLILGT